MKRILTMAFVAAALCVPAAQAATPKGPTMAQFNALKAQLAKDEKTIKAQTTAINALAAIVECEVANTADALQGSWQAIDTLAVSLGKPAVFGTQAPIGDNNTCSIFSITRSHAAPPNTSVFSALTALIG
jgi:hypothetical protein